MNKNNPKIILISGKARSGKDTFAQLFKENAEKDNKKCLIIKYGDILKFVCSKYFNWNGEKDEAGRTLLQQVGTNLIRKNNSDTWVNCIIELVKGLRTEFDYVLIPDVRFYNEIIKWKEQEFDCVTVRINRWKETENRKIVAFDNGLTEEQKNHPSETALDNYNFDYNIDNCEYETYLKDICLLYNELEGKGNIMTDADKMIEKLGYTSKFDHYPYYVFYEKDLGQREGNYYIDNTDRYETDLIHLTFDYEEHTVIKTLGDDNSPVEITVPESKAINEKFKELGWI